jgi:alkylation response protein AidB-like acyl-CoA dehydrogenase
MGWLAAPIAEEFSGLGFTPVETALIAEQLGRGLVLEPYTQCAVLPAAIVTRCAFEPQKEAILAAIASAEKLIAVAHSERESRGNVAQVSTIAAQKADGGYVLNGHKTLVVGATVADQLIVVARSSGGANEKSGISIFLVDAKTPGITLQTYKLLDGTPAADVILDDVMLEADALLGEEGAAYSGLQAAIDEAIVALCAETVGGMDDVIALCSDYLKVRKQFGVAIGSFQALQHRMADMAIEASQARATLHRALAAQADETLADRSVVISGCKAQVTRSAKFVTAQGIQLHGGYGITEEYRVGHHYRRMVLTDALFGNQDYHLSRYARHIQSQPREFEGV